jgi:ATP-dependent protease ClpP protease subunit
MSNPAYVSFLSPVNPTTAQALMGVIGKQLPKGTDEIHLMLSTPGGNVREGVALYNLLRALPTRLITYNVGTVDSIGNVVFLAGDDRYAAQTSSFMFHGVGFDVQNTRFEKKTLTERLDSLQNDQSLISDIIIQRTNINAQEAEALFLQAAFIRADDAKARGIINDIRDVQVPQGAPFIQLVFQG